MSKINFRYAVYGTLYWLLLNLGWGFLTVLLERHLVVKDLLYAFTGMILFYFASQNIFVFLYYFFITTITLYWWLRKPGLFKALALIGLGPFLELYAFSSIFTILPSTYWMLGFIFAAYSIRWVITGKFTPILEK